MASKKIMAGRQSLFVEEYLKDFNGAHAAIRAGYSEKHARKSAWQMLQKPHIQDAIAKRVKELLAKEGITPEQVINELGIIFCSDITDFVTWNEDNAFFIPSDKIPKEKRRAISEIQADVVTRTDEEGNSEQTVKLKLKMWDKMKAIEKLGQYFRLFMEQKEVSVTIKVEERLSAALARMEAHRANEHKQIINN